MATWFVYGPPNKTHIYNDTFIHTKWSFGGIFLTKSSSSYEAISNEHYTILSNSKWRRAKVVCDPLLQKSLLDSITVGTFNQKGFPWRSWMFNLILRVFFTNSRSWCSYRSMSEQLISLDKCKYFHVEQSPCRQNTPNSK